MYSKSNCLHLFLLISFFLSMCMLAPVFAKTIEVNGYDTTAIEEAIEEALFGDIVYFPEGKYLITDSIRPKSGIKLIGDGQNNTIIQYTGNENKPIILIDDTAGNKEKIEISEMTLHGGISPATMGISVSYGQDYKLHHLTIQNINSSDDWAPHGIRLFQVSDSEISNNIIKDIKPVHCNSVGIIFKGASGNKILNNTISNTGRGGIICLDSEDTRIKNNTVSESGQAGTQLGCIDTGLAIELNGCNGGIVTDNNVDTWISAARAYTCSIRRNTVTGGNGISSNFTGLELADSSYCIFTDNKVQGTKLGISISQCNYTPEYSYWAYNEITNAVQWGIQIQGEIPIEPDSDCYKGTDYSPAQFHYFFQNKFLNTGQCNCNSLPEDYGAGFRFNEYCQNITLDNNLINDNCGDGIQVLNFTSKMEQLIFFNNIITDNRGKSISFAPDIINFDLEWCNNTAEGNNGGDIQLSCSDGFIINRKPTASFTYNYESPGVIRFTNTSSDPDGTIASLFWDFGDGIPEFNAETPTHVYPGSGEYRVSLVVWDNDRVGAQTEKQVHITEIPPYHPIDVTASDGVYPDTVRVTWDSVSGASSYEVYRAASSISTKTKLLTTTNTTYDDISAGPDIIYYYWLKACNTWGCSNFSPYNTGYRDISQVGDVNGDGTINIVDALLIAQFSAGLPMPPQFNESNGDTDCNGFVTIVDAYLVARYAAHLSMDGTSWCGA
jgi:parallel beta-helix repeat protein